MSFIQTKGKLKLCSLITVLAILFFTCSFVFVEGRVNTYADSPETYYPNLNGDFSNHYIVNIHEEGYIHSNTGMLDSMYDSTNELIDQVDSMINDSNNAINITLSQYWGYIPRRLDRNGSVVGLYGEFYNTNKYSAITGINDFSIALLNSAGKIVYMKDFIGDKKLNNIMINYNENVKVKFILKNVPENIDFNNFQCVISSKFSTVVDEAGLKADHPEIYELRQYYKSEAQKAYDKVEQLTGEYLDKVDEYQREKLIDGASY